MGGNPIVEGDPIVDPIVKLMKAADAVVLPLRRKPVESPNLTDEEWHHLGGKMSELIEKEWKSKTEADGFTNLSNQKSASNQLKERTTKLLRRTT